MAKPPEATPEATKNGVRIHQHYIPECAEIQQQVASQSN